MDMRRMLLNHEIVLCIYDSDVIGQHESWMLKLETGCSSRELKPKRSFGLIERRGRAFCAVVMTNMASKEQP